MQSLPASQRRNPGCAREKPQRGTSGLLNGWGVFSTLRVAGGVPFAFERHWERMQRDAQGSRSVPNRSGGVESAVAAIVEAIPHGTRRCV